MNIPEEFWRSNLEPAAYDASPDKAYEEILRLISWNEEKLLASNKIV